MTSPVSSQLRGFTPEQRRSIEEMRQMLVDVLSHELRTPQTYLRHAVSSLLDENVEWGGADEVAILRTIDAEAKRVLSVLGSLDELTTVLTGSTAISFAPVSPVEVARSAVSEAGTVLISHRVQLLTDHSFVPIQANEKLVVRALVALLHNAAKYSPVSSKIILTVKQGTGLTMFAVADEGPGIQENDHLRMFDLFARDANGSVPGNERIGLGLVKAIVDAHAGHVDVQSRPGKGSVFTLALPWTQVATPSEPARTAQRLNGRVNGDATHAARSGRE